MDRQEDRNRIMPNGQSEQPIRGVGRGQHDLEKRKRQIEARLISIRAREQFTKRKRETRANIIIRAIVRSHATLHPAFVPTLVNILDIGVRRQADRLLLASMLGLPEFPGSYNAVASPVAKSGHSARGSAGFELPQWTGLQHCVVEITDRYRSGRRSQRR
jgi:hypothetical protein